MVRFQAEEPPHRIRILKVVSLPCGEQTGRGKSGRRATGGGSVQIRWGVMAGWVACAWAGCGVLLRVELPGPAAGEVWEWRWVLFGVSGWTWVPLTETHGGARGPSLELGFPSCWKRVGIAEPAWTGKSAREPGPQSRGVTGRSGVAAVRRGDMTEPPGRSSCMRSWPRWGELLPRCPLHPRAQGAKSLKPGPERVSVLPGSGGGTQEGDRRWEWGVWNGGQPGPLKFGQGPWYVLTFGVDQSLTISLFYSTKLFSLLLTKWNR